MAHPVDLYRICVAQDLVVELLSGKRGEGINSPDRYADRIKLHVESSQRNSADDAGVIAPESRPSGDVTVLVDIVEAGGMVHENSYGRDHWNAPGCGSRIDVSALVLPGGLEVMRSQLWAETGA